MKPYEIMSPEAYKEMKHRWITHEAWSRQFVQKNGWTVIPADAVPPVTITNEERSMIERFEFCRDKPDRYFLYVQGTPNNEPNHSQVTVTTFTGATLGEGKLGVKYRVKGRRGQPGGPADVRYPITVTAINGETYKGVYYADQGTFARVRKVAA